MRRKSMFLLVLTGAICVFTVLLALSRPAKAGSGSTRILARSQFRDTVDSSSSKRPKGTLLLIEEGGKQSLRAEIKDLDEINFGLFIGPTQFYDGTNTPVFYVTVMNRTGKRAGNWSRNLIGTNGAPAELQVYGVTNLSDLSNISSFQIGNPGFTNFTGGTQIVNTNCVTDMDGNLVCTWTTNLVGGVTNIYINAFVWAPVPTLVSNPSAFNFHTKVKMVQPSPPPSPNAHGTILATYSGSSGRSLLDVRINNMVKGQEYALWVSDAGTNVQAGIFEALGKTGSTNAKFRRDTQDGEPLPVQVANIADLTNRIFQVRDGFGVVHLEYIAP
jgi:hypothetical protein